MSSYKKITKHPITGKYEDAEYIDDYFMPHVYGVKFPSDDKVYPAELIDSYQVKNFFAADALNAFSETVFNWFAEEEKTQLKNMQIEFLNNVQKEYKSRWSRDPIGGEDATLEGAE